MTKRIRLSYGLEAASTSVSNIFIDNYMADAHGSYVKVYIYLLRCLSDPEMPVSIANISDKLDETEKDIVKALKYWEKKKLLSVSYDIDGEVSSIAITDLSVTPEEQTPRARITRTASSIIEEPAVNSDETPCEILPVNTTKPNYTANQISSFREFSEFDSLLDFIEDSYGHPLTLRELQTPAFLFESLAFPAELIKFLYSYCLGKGKTSSAYIEKVAREWASKSINTVDKAKKDILACTKEYAVIRSAFGITRALGAAEFKYADKWTNEYHMSPELISEACSRSLINTGKPDFKYADGILNSWYSANASSMADIHELDRQHTETRVKPTQSKTAPKRQTTNNFAQFPQRSYSQEDYDAIERRKLNLS